MDTHHHSDCYAKVALLEQMILTMQKEHTLLNERLIHLSEHMLILERMVERGCAESKN